MEPLETVPPSKMEAPISSLPRSRLRSPIQDVLDELRELTCVELADVQQYVQRIRAARGVRPSPELVTQLVATVGRLRQTYSGRVPISLIRAALVNVPRVLFDQALFDAQSRHLLRIEPVELPAPFIEIGAGIQHERGLLYWIVPY